MAKTKKGELVVQEGGVPAVYDYSEYEGAGFEDHSREDYAIPFLAVLQALSPQVEEMEDAKAGMIINTVTGDLYKGNEGVAVVPSVTKHVYVEWRKRSEGGGFVGVHELDSEVVQRCKAEQRFGEYETEDGNDLIETFYVYGVLVKEDGSHEQVVLAFSSTKIKKYKQWMTKARTIMIPAGGRKINPPLFAHRYRLTTVKEKNKKGEFYNFAVGFDGQNAAECRLAPDDEVFQAAASMRTLVNEGAARAAYESQAAAGGDEDTGAPPF